MSYVKKYELGELGLDLAYANCIYELPLLSFGDMHHSVNLSLVFNQQVKETGINTFNIAQGYKLNLQKRIFFEDGYAFFQDANGKKIKLFPYNDGYTFDDDSQRIIRTGTSYYTLEHPDFSTEIYELNGRIKATYDKYGKAVLTYKYENDLLTEIAFREEEGTTSSKKISFVYNNATSQLHSITYSGNSDDSTTFIHNDNHLLVAHYSGVSYGLSTIGKNYYVTIGGTENTASYSYAKKCIFDSDNNTVTISDYVAGNVVNRTIYKYPDLAYAPNVASSYVEITDYLGAKTRVQFNSGKATCSYEISENDVEFKNDNQYMGSVNVYRTEDDLFNTSTPYVQDYHKGVQLNSDSNGRYNFSLASFGLNSGSYIISGWAKVKENCTPGIFSVYIMSSPSVCAAQYEIAIGKYWRYFAFETKFSSNDLYVVFQNLGDLEIKDIRLIFKPTHIWLESKSQIVPVAEDVLIDRRNENYIKLEDLYISSNEFDPEIDWISFDDILRYTVNKKKNPDSSEFYCSKSKTVIPINSSQGVILKRQNGDNVESFNLNDYYLGRRSYSSRGIVITQVIDDDPTCFLRYKSVSEYGELLTSRTYNDDMDVIAETYDKLVKTYTRNNGLVTSTSIRSLDNSVDPYSTSTVYNETNGNITYTDEYGKITRYNVDPTWGVVLKVRLPDGTTINNTYDDDKSALLSKSFVIGGATKTNEFSYSGGEVISMFGGGLDYTFEYTKGDLTKVSKNGSPIEEHAYTPTQITSYYPYGYDEEDVYHALYSITRNYDKYGRLSSINNVLANTYSVYPSYDESTGALIESTHADNAEGRLAIMTDSLTSEVSRYKYTDEGQIVARMVTKTNFETKVSNESFSYDEFQRLSSHTFVYDAPSSSSIGDIVTYVKPVTDPSADNFVYTHTYNIDGVRHAYTYNKYDALKRLKEKHVTLTPQNVYYNRTIEYSKTRVSSISDDFSGHFLGSENYEYDAMGRISTEKDSNDNVVKRYSYDIYGQLKREDNFLLDKTFSYSYNDNGNLVEIKRYDYTTGTPSGTPVTTSFGYSGDKLTSFNGKAITYNANGEVATYDGWNYSWNKGKLSTIRRDYGGSAKALAPSLKNSKTYSFVYNALGQRVKCVYSHFFNTSSIIPVAQGEVTNYTRAYSYDSLGRLISESITETLYGEGTVSSEIVFLYDESSVIGMKYISPVYGTNTYYYRKNLQGDVIGIYNTTGTMLVRYTYDAWGNCTIHSSTTNNVLARVNPIRYRSYYYDTSTGLYYLNARYYNPQWCRFISPDDTSYLDPETPNGLNLYAYCNNDPVNYADPSGHSAFLIAMSILAVAGLITTGIGVAADNSIVTAIGLTAVAVPALITGTMAFSLLTPVGIGIGITTVAAGSGTALFASAEYQEAFTDNNWLLDAGMSEDVYNILMLTTATIATLGTAASSLAYSFNINTITEIGKIKGSKYKGIKFTQIRNGKPVYRSLEFHHGHAHGGHKLHWQLNKWSKTGIKSRGGTAWWTIWLKRIP